MLFRSRGLLLALDYGYVRSAYYHPSRSDGTLLCHVDQAVHSDPMRLVGLQDLTASVDFTALARAAQDLGFEVNGFTSQTWFLLGCGLEQRLSGPDAPDVATIQAAKRLLMPQEMGDRVQALALTRDLDISLDAFALRDVSPRLELG